MNGKDVVAVIMAVNKLDGPCFTSEDEDVSARRCSTRSSSHGFAHCVCVCTTSPHAFAHLRAIISL